MRDKGAPTAVAAALVLVVVLVGGDGFGAAAGSVAQDATPVATEAFTPTHVVTDPGIAGSTLNLRFEPRSSAPIVVAHPVGAPVQHLGNEVVDEDGQTWLDVATADGRTGWAPADGFDPLGDADRANATRPPTPVGTPDLVVGSWAERRNRGDHLTFFADGNALLTDATGQTFHGAWRPVDDPDSIGSYIFQAWGRGGGTGRSGPIVRVTADELDLGNAVYDRLVAPGSEAAGVRGGNQALPAATRPTDPLPANAEASAAPAATPVAGAAPAADDPFPGIAVEDLANVTAIPCRMPLGQVALTRVTMRPGAVFADPFPYPVLVAVEAGTLTVDAISPGVTVTSPPETIAANSRRQTVQAEGEGVITREDGGVTVQHRFSEIAPGGTASVLAGGSVFGEANGIGALRNDGDQPLVLLLVALAPAGGSDRWAATEGGREAKGGSERIDAVAGPGRSGGRGHDDDSPFCDTFPFCD